MSYDVKEAVKIAKSFVANMFEEGTYADLRLEEVVSSYDEIQNHNIWVITLSFERQVSAEVKALGGAIGVQIPRDYKEFEVDEVTGEVRAMRISKAG